MIKPHTIKHMGSINVALQGRVPVKHATEREQGQEGDQEKEKEHSRLSLIQHRAING